MLGEPVAYAALFQLLEQPGLQQVIDPCVAVSLVKRAVHVVEPNVGHAEIPGQVLDAIGKVGLQVRGPAHQVAFGHVLATEELHLAHGAVPRAGTELDAHEAGHGRGECNARARARRAHGQVDGAAVPGSPSIKTTAGSGLNS